MGDLFLSYSSRDKAVAATLQAELEADGLRVFLDSDHEDGIAPGAEWMQALFAELRLCHAVVFLNSANSQGSKWCHTELAIAIQMGKEVFALHVDPSPPLSPYPLLDHLQSLNHSAYEPSSLVRALMMRETCGGTETVVPTLASRRSSPAMRACSSGVRRTGPAWSPASTRRSVTAMGGSLS